MEKNIRYWQSLEQFENEAEFRAAHKDEFAEDLPVLGGADEVAKEGYKGNRRDFLKMLGFSVSAATIAASCEIPVKYAIPYVQKPEEITPGIASYYASTFLDGSDFCNVLVKTRDGRPIKIEGNPESPLTQGGTSARAQASVLSLYDINRVKHPMKGENASTWGEVDSAISQSLRSGGQAVLLTSGIASPSTRQLIADMRANFPDLRHVEYSPISYSGLRKSNQICFGDAVIPSYNFAKAAVIVGLSADFLGTWVSPVQFAKDYSKNRRVSADKPTMSRHYQFETRMSMTGANADYRQPVKVSEQPAVAIALYNAIAGKSGNSTASGGSIDAATQEMVNKAALDLWTNRGHALVVCGSNDPNTQVIVNAINIMLDSYGSTIDLGSPYMIGGGDDAEFNQLVADMGSGRISTLLIQGVNPIFDSPLRDQFATGLGKVKTSVSFSSSLDETAAKCDYVCPDHHYLEKWNDAELKKGQFSICQPTISPLFDTRSWQESLLTWMGAGSGFYSYIQNFWKSNIYGRQNKHGNFQSFWDHSVHDGVVSMPTGVAGAPGFNGDVASAAAKAVNAAKSTGEFELELYQNISLGDGRYANNPYLQETPDPISKVCWDNFVAVSYDDAKANGWKRYDVLEVSANGYSIQLPVVVQPGQANGTCSIALGYGRTKGVNERCQVGQDAFPFMSYNGESLAYHTGVSLQKVGSGYQLALTQTHNFIDDTGVKVLAKPKPRIGIINEAKLADYKEDKYVGNTYGRKLSKPGYKEEYLFTLYDDRPELQDGHHWNLGVDLNTCIGCSACVVSCHLENNVPVVGQEEVFRAHEMHWMRIDRYYAGDPQNPRVAFQPMMCQHCDNAPCENVCPVAATNHSSEGLNQMAYNRCIGTRYCANNCPYKVRRFNWYDWQGADSFYKGTIFDNDDYTIVDDLSRMVLNPDVTVRSRGVMEKCTFCVQRIQDGKLEAKKAGVPLADGAIKTACQTACPTDAIMFGDINDPDSEISKWRANERAYRMLEEIHVLPSVNYLTKIRNVDELDSWYDTRPDDGDHGSHGHDDHGHDGHDKHKKGHDGHDHEGHDHDHGHGHDHDHGHDGHGH